MDSMLFISSGDVTSQPAIDSSALEGCVICIPQCTPCHSLLLKHEGSLIKPKYSKGQRGGLAQSHGSLYRALWNIAAYTFSKVLPLH